MIRPCPPFLGERLIDIIVSELAKKDELSSSGFSEGSLSKMGCVASRTLATMDGRYPGTVRKASEHPRAAPRLKWTLAMTSRRMCAAATKA